MTMVGRGESRRFFVPRIVTPLYVMLMVLLLLVLSNPAGSDSVISGCQVLNESTVYVLEEDMTVSGTCFTVTADDLTLDCQLHRITGNGTGTGVSFFNNSLVTIKNCVFEQFDTGLDVYESFIRVETTLLEKSNRGILTRGYFYVDAELNSFRNNTFNIENTNESVLLEAQNNWFGSNDSAVINASVSGNVSIPFWLEEDPFSDNDLDAVFDFVDNCNVANPNQSDSDYDGLGDVCDNCIMDYNPFQGDLDNDTIGDVCDYDADDDSICDFGPSLTEPLPENVARDKMINASAFVDPYVPLFAVDGDNTTFLALVGEPPQYVTIDLGQIIPLDRFVIVFNDSLSRLYDYTVALSEDGSNFSMVIAVSKNEDVRNDIFFNLTPARFFRLTLLDYDFDDDDVRINEIELYSSLLLCRGGQQEEDVCPTIANPDQNDSDDDGRGNECDNCPFDDNPDQDDADLDDKGDACDQNLFLLNSVYDPLTEEANISSQFLTAEDTGYYVIQFYGFLTQNQSEELEGIGVEFLEYIPDNGYIVFFDPLIKTQIQNLSYVRFLGIFQPADRLSSGLYRIINEALLEDNETLNLTIFTFQHVQEVNESITGLGATVQYVLNDSLGVETEVKNILNISFIPDVSSVTILPAIEFFGFKTPLTLGVRKSAVIGKNQNFYGYEGDGQVIGHLDTGTDTSHAELGASVIPNEDIPFSRDCNAPKNMEPRGLEKNNGEDPIGHGTATAGVAVGAGVSGMNYKQESIRGIAPLASLYSTKVCNANVLKELQRTLFTGRFPEDDVIYAFDNSYERGARVYTNSWGTATGPSTFYYCRRVQKLTEPRNYDVRINRFVFEKQDFLPFFAASNTGRDFEDTLSYIPLTDILLFNAFKCSVYETSQEFGWGNLANPGVAKNVLTVGGLEQELKGCDGVRWFKKENAFERDDMYDAESCHRVDSDTDLWGGSSRGPTPDLRLKPDVVTVASGRFIVRSSQMDDEVSKHYVSTLGGDPYYLAAQYHFGPQYRVSYGTSFATPAAAAVGALIREYYQKEQTVEKPSAALLKATVINGAQDVPNRLIGIGPIFGADYQDLYSQTGSIPNFREGWGKVNFSNSIKPCWPYQCLRYKDNEIVETKVIFPYRFSSDRAMGITFTWMDPPDSSLTSRSLVNELELEMTSPTGIKYKSTFNNFNEEGESVDESAKDYCRLIYVDQDTITDEDHVMFNIKASASSPLRLRCNEPEKVKSNVKRLILKEPEDGFWNITIKGKSVNPSFTPNGQNFALVVSGVRGIDAANETDNATNFFPYGNLIYAYGQGLPSETPLQLVVVANRHDFAWDSTQTISESSNKNEAVNGFTLFTYEETATTDNVNGTLPKKTLLWDPNTPGIFPDLTKLQKAIFDAKGHFNVFVDFGEKKGVVEPDFGSITYDVKEKDPRTHEVTKKDSWKRYEDVVDYHKTVGFRIGYAGASHSPNGGFNDFDDEFSWGTSSEIFAMGVGFEPKTKVDLYVMKDRNWENGDSLQGSIRFVDDASIGDEGELGVEIWDDIDRKEVGFYDLIVDVNQNGIYDPKMDVIDGRSDPGFKITCQPEEEICGAIASSFTGGEPTDAFAESNAVAANLHLFKKHTGEVRVYTVKQFTVIRAGIPLEDVSESVETLVVPPSTDFTKTLDLWKAQTKKELGGYEIVIDVDEKETPGYGIFDPELDIYDPDGFVVTNAVREQKIAVDSKGNLHVAGRQVVKEDESGMFVTQVLYAKIPKEQRATIDLEHPDLFAWSKDKSIVFTTVDESFYYLTRYVDIAVDANDIPHLVYMKESKNIAFSFLIYLKLKFDIVDDKEVVSIAKREPIYYKWQDYMETRLNYPTITIDPLTNEPVISARVAMQYPDNFYFGYVYPVCLTESGLRSMSSALMGYFGGFFIYPSFSGLIPKSTKFTGQSLQLIKRSEGYSGFPEWPGDINKFPESASLYSGALVGVTTCAGAPLIKKSPPNWQWTTIDETSTLGVTFDFSNALLDNEGTPHVLYRRYEDTSEGTFNQNTPQRLFYKQLSGDYPYLQQKVSENVPEPWVPGMDIDDKRTVHTVWESEDKVFYNEVTSEKVGKQRLVTSLEKRPQYPFTLAKPQLGVDAQDILHIAYVRSKDNDRYDEYSLEYIKGQQKEDKVTFAEPVLLADSTTFPVLGYGEIAEPALTISKLARPTDWTDRVFVTWVETAQFTMVKMRKTTPHVVVLIVAGGMDDDTLFSRPEKIPRIQQLLDDTNGYHSRISSSVLGTTMTSQADFFTGLYPSKHFIIGDNFMREETDLEFVPFDHTPYTTIDTLWTEKGVMTLFDYLAKNEKHSAALPSLYSKGITQIPPDFMMMPLVSFISGAEFGQEHRKFYLTNLKNNDAKRSNDAPDLMVIYLLTNDLGEDRGVWEEGMTPEEELKTIDPNEVDSQIGEIIDALKTSNLYDDTLFIITSDLGLKNVEKDSFHALANWDLGDLRKPEGLEVTDLFLNGFMAYSKDGLDVARVFSNNSRYIQESSWFGTLQRILLKQDGIYQRYYYDGANDVFEPASDFFLPFLMGNPPFAESPNMILIASQGYYFHDFPHYAAYGHLSWLPFVVAGSGYDLFVRGNKDLAKTLRSIDVTPTIGYFVGGQSLVDKMVGIDGRNAFQPELVIEGGSPVDFHLYDSQGKHTGINEFGDIETEIPGSDYRIDPTTNKKKITVLQFNESYRFVVSAYAYGSFNVSILLMNESNTIYLTYPLTNVSKDSVAQLDLSGSFIMNLDYDGDEIFETTIQPLRNIIVEQSTMDHTAYVTILSLPTYDLAALDLTDATDVLLTLKTKTMSISDGRVTIEKIANNSFDAPSFFTIGSLWRVNITDNVLTNAKKINLTILYPEYELIPRHLAESSLALYDTQTLVRLNGSVDPLSNSITVSLTRSGSYILASTDQTPIIHDVLVSPQISNIPEQMIRVEANITDDHGIVSVIAMLENRSQEMVYNGITERYEASLPGPLLHGTYPLTVIATDDTNNTMSKESSFMLDLRAPLLTMISPENITYLTNSIDLSFYTDEATTISYTLDNEPQIPLNATRSFIPVTYPLIILGGNHSLVLSAADLFNNTQTVGVNFSVAFQNAKVSAIELPLYERPNELFSVKATIENTMMENLTDLEVQLLVDGNLSNAVRVDLPGESSKDLFFSVLLLEGRPNITVSVVPALNETFVEDNTLSKEILITQKVPVLLVNDDPNSNTTLYTKPIQESGGLGYDVVVHNNTAGMPTAAVLDMFRIVVWVTGVASEQSLDPYEQARLQQYLDTGGNLLVFSNRLGHERGTTGFYQNYLSAAYRRVAPTKTIEGVFRDPVGKGLLFTLTEPGEEIQALAPATESLEYSNADGAAVKYEGTTFKTAYYTFGLEDVPDPLTRTTLVERTFAYFAIDFIPPTMTNKQPVDNTSFAINTSSVMLSLATDESATCRYSFITTEYSAMLAFNETGEINHRTELTNLSNGAYYTVFLNCRDKHGNQNNKETILFFIHNRTFFPPQLEPLPDMNIAENETLAILLNVSDPEGDPLNITITDHEVFGYVPLADRFVLTNTTLSLQTTFEDAGQYQLTILVTDGFATVATTFSLVIENVNRPPVLTPLGSQHLLEDTYYSVTVEATDPDGEDLMFADNATFFTIHPITGAISLTPKQANLGEYLVNITVTDGQLTVFEVVPFTITNTNDAPVILFIPPQRVQEGTSFMLQVNASDADADNILFSDNTTLFNISSEGIVSFTPTNGDVGNHLITITASDGLSNDTKLLNLVVDVLNQPPLFQIIPTEIYVMMNSLLEINVTACDPDLDPECVP
ncbi:S8 family serine peptidase [Candidatus Woesearchaeota archaeon]|nr:S8 family serine peptidase [Candidatus Woesearchaeota archaeon]